MFDDRKHYSRSPLFEVRIGLLLNLAIYEYEHAFLFQVDAWADDTANERKRCRDGLPSQGAWPDAVFRA